MKPTTSIPPVLIDNAALFTDAFFQRFKLRPAAKPLILNDEISKNYLFPTFYDDVTCAMAIFLCSYEKAAALLPDKRMEPVSMLGGRSLVLISCYEYKKVLGIAPYNELAINIPVLLDSSCHVPLLPILLPQFFKNFGYYCFGMPVTSLENQIRGVKIWGLPKTVNEINFQHSQNQVQVQVLAETGELGLELNIPQTGKVEHLDTSAYLMSMKEGALLKSKTCFKGDFSVIKNNRLLFGKSAQGSILNLGVGDLAQKLKNLEIDPRPFQTRYCPKMVACFE